MKLLVLAALVASAASIQCWTGGASDKESDPAWPGDIAQKVQCANSGDSCNKQQGNYKKKDDSKTYWTVRGACSSALPFTGDQTESGNAPKNSCEKTKITDAVK